MLLFHVNWWRLIYQEVVSAEYMGPKYHLQKHPQPLQSQTTCQQHANCHHWPVMSIHRKNLISHYFSHPVFLFVFLPPAPCCMQTEDYLKRKIRCRPERSELVRMHILEGGFWCPCGDCMESSAAPPSSSHYPDPRQAWLKHCCLPHLVHGSVKTWWIDCGVIGQSRFSFSLLLFQSALAIRRESRVDPVIGGPQAIVLRWLCACDVLC